MAIFHTYITINVTNLLVLKNMNNIVKVNRKEIVSKVCNAVQMVHKLEVIKLTDDDVWASEQTQDVLLELGGDRDMVHRQVRMGRYESISICADDVNRQVSDESKRLTFLLMINNLVFVVYIYIYSKKTCLIFLLI